MDPGLSNFPHQEMQVYTFVHLIIIYTIQGPFIIWAQQELQKNFISYRRRPLTVLLIQLQYDHSDKKEGMCVKSVRFDRDAIRDSLRYFDNNNPPMWDMLVGVYDFTWYSLRVYISYYCTCSINIVIRQFLKIPIIARCYIYPCPACHQYRGEVIGNIFPYR